jgi:hypothetical protein
MNGDDIFSDEFHQTVLAAWKHEREESLRLGLPVFERDDNAGIDVMEQNGRRFEIRFIPGAPGDRNFEVLRELSRSAA